MSRIAIGIAHGHVPKWLQIAIYSLKKFNPGVNCDIWIAETWPDHPSIKAITENDLGDNINIIQCTIRKHSHATALDQILDDIADSDSYDYMFSMETDCMACKDGWLDWFYQFLANDLSRGMAGFFWHEGDHHYNINPSGTLYLKSMLLKYHKEVRENNENMFWHPRGNKHGNDAGMDPTIKDVAGVFSETRGIKDPTPAQLDGILKGIPFASWFEPGAWLWCRSLGEYGGVSVPCDHIYQKFGRHTAPEGTYYGGKANPQFLHLWAGTRSYDAVKHLINDTFVLECAPLWMEREHRIWKSFVPEKYRKAIPSIYEEMEFEKKMKENMSNWQEIADKLGPNWGKGGDI